MRVPRWRRIRGGASSRHPPMMQLGALGPRRRLISRPYAALRAATALEITLAASTRALSGAVVVSCQ